MNVDMEWMMSIGNGCEAVWMERSCLSHLRNRGAPSIVCNISLSGPRPHYHRLMELHQVLSHLIPESYSKNAAWNNEISRSNAGKAERAEEQMGNVGSEAKLQNTNSIS